MKPIEQRQRAIFDASGDNLQRGDCLTACVASLFELPIDDVPFFVESDTWWDDYLGFVRSLGFQVAQVRLTTADDDPTRLTGHPIAGIYWLATVLSPRGQARCSVCRGERETAEQWDDERSKYVTLDAPAPCTYCKATGLIPSLHCVVMCGGDIAWDPHPERTMGHLGFVSGEWFVAIDPARLAIVTSSGDSDFGHGPS